MKAKKKQESIVVTGKRKTSIAKATIKKAPQWEIRVNNFPLSIFPELRRLVIEEPIRIAQQFINNSFQIKVRVKGGGVESQAEAARLAIARALIEATKNQKLKKIFNQYDWSLIVADTRRKEACKPRDSKARARRQTSYR